MVDKCWNGEGVISRPSERMRKLGVGNYGGCKSYPLISALVTCKSKAWPHNATVTLRSGHPATPLGTILISFSYKLVGGPQPSLQATFDVFNVREGT